MVILPAVHLNKGSHTVRGFSESLMISEPAVIRAIDRFADKFSSANIKLIYVKISSSLTASISKAAFISALV